MRLTETDLILPSLYIIKLLGEVSTAQLIKYLEVVFKPVGEDAKILKSRSDTKFSQKVRNLTSHRNANKMGLYTSFEWHRYSINELGEEYLEQNIDTVKEQFEDVMDELLESAGQAIGV